MGLRLRALRVSRHAGVFPSFLHDQQHFLFFSAQGEPGIYAGSLNGDDSKRLVESDSGGVFDPRSGYLLFVRQQTLLAQTFNPQTLTLSGDPIPVAEHIQANAPSGHMSFSIADTGILAYGAGTAEGDRSLQLT